MARPREQAGGLAEASRLLQEGLQLLAEREREVDRLLEDARERALLIREEAEQRAAQTVAEAEQHHTELEELVAGLRSEVESLRAEIASLKAASAVPELAAASNNSSAADAKREFSEAANEPDESVENREANTASIPESPEAPRWGRQSTALSGQQAVRTNKSSKPRWLPPWLPFVLLVAVAASVLATNVHGQPGTRATVQEPGDAAQPRATAEVEVAAADVTATPPPLLAPTPAALPAVMAPTAALGLQVSDTPVPPTTASAASQPLALPPAGALLGSPVAVPGDASIVAAYTAYTSYTVQPGDTLNRLATQFGVSGDTIVRSSGLVDPNLLVPGQVLSIPRESGWLYRATTGDTLETIALRLGLSSDDLLQANPNLASGSVKPGDLVFVPDRGVPPPKR
jgi:LysM repeat protein